MFLTKPKIKTKIQLETKSTKNHFLITKTKPNKIFTHLVFFISITEDVQDDESHWQDRVSSGFDRLVAFASTELDKTRRSIEDVSCNTSPDSGINNSDGRHFLSSSSSSSQIDLHPKAPEQIESPPLSESGQNDNLPKTPSPTASPVIYSSNSSHHQSLSSIPLKYQRQSKSSSSAAASEKHYKKKFRERTWEYDFDDGNMEMEVNHQQQQHHKSSKFRPKGKGWGWNSEQQQRKNSIEDKSAT